MKDNISKKEFNREMKNLDAIDRGVERSMSSYYSGMFRYGVMDIMYHISLILLNIVFWYLAYIYLVNTVGVSKFSDFVGLIDFKKLAIYGLIFSFSIVLCRVLCKLIVIKLVSKYIRPYLSVRLTLGELFQSKLGYGNFISQEYTMTRSSMDMMSAGVVTTCINIGRFIGITIVGIVLGIVYIFYIDSVTTIVIGILNLFSILILVSLFMFMVVSIKNKDGVSVLVFNISKFLYKARIVKDFDSIFEVLSLKVMHIERVLQNFKKYLSNIFVSMIGYIFEIVLKVGVVCLILNMFVSQFWFYDYLLVLIFVAVIDGVCRLDLFKNKFILKEFLVIVLFSYFSLKGYMFYFMVLYVLCDYYFGFMVGFLYILLDKFILSRFDGGFNKSISRKRMRRLQKENK